MSTLLNRILGNLATRMMLIIYLSIILITAFFIVFSYYNELSLQEQRQYDKLKAVVSSMSQSIDGDAHDELMDRYVSDKQGAIILQDPVYHDISTKLSIAAADNELRTIYTLVYDPDIEGFVYGVRSDDFVDFKNRYVLSPKELIEHMETGGTIPLYMSENGSWLSAFHPIRNSKGEVVALLEADIEFSEFKALVNERYFREIMMAVIVIILMALILIPYARKVLNQDEKQRKLALEQRLLIESKNRDIMDSMRYALKIQSAMLPPLDRLSKNGLEGFVLHQAKDVVAGDFYWIEKHDNYLFFAVADCTGHGVPGAIISILCSNALNRAVDVMRMRNTGEILDSVREMIVARLGEGEDGMRDGMDIALCRLDLDTLELQYTGANNPIYIYQSEKDKMVIAKPCKQPVGRHIEEHPFKCQSFQLNKGDQLYLFTDGFADQFGGDNGKKFKYKPFRELMAKHAGLSMHEQKKILKKELRNWMRDYDQVDDICVMGVRV